MSTTEQGGTPARSERLQRLLTAQDLAERFQVPRRTIFSWVDQGLLPAHRAGKRLLRFTDGDAEEFMRRSAEAAP